MFRREYLILIMAACLLVYCWKITVLPSGPDGARCETTECR